MANTHISIIQFFVLLSSIHHLTCILKYSTRFSSLSVQDCSPYLIQQYLLPNDNFLPVEHLVEVVSLTSGVSMSVDLAVRVFSSADCSKAVG